MTGEPLTRRRPNMRTLIRHIAQLVVVPRGPVSGGALSGPPVIENAAVLIEGGRIAWFGPENDAPVKLSGLSVARGDGPSQTSPSPRPSFSGGEGVVVIDAGGGTVVPGLVDGHTHAVFAGSREREFVQRIEGADYIEILEAGGGIKSSVRMLRAADETALIEQSRPRLERMLASGTTTVEIKSGYGLSPKDELKTLRAIRALAGELPLEIVPTYLGAHTIPPEFDGRPDAYLDEMTADGLLGEIAAENLAEFADVFCERGAFTVEQSRRFLTACRAHGMKPKVHAEQITRSGATQLAVELGAASADHLECVNDEDIAALKGSDTIPVLLPGCSFFLGSKPAPARRLIEAGLPLALSTDCNPGSAMIESLPLIMSIAATMLKMTPLETLVSCTANAAAAIGRADRIGAIAVGHQADLLVLDVPNIELWPYRVGVNAVKTVIKNGRVVVGENA